MYEDLRIRSKNFLGIDRDVFVKFSPIPVSQNCFRMFSFVLLNRVSGGTEFLTVLEEKVPRRSI